MAIVVSDWFARGRNDIILPVATLFLGVIKGNNPIVQPCESNEIVCLHFHTLAKQVKLKGEKSFNSNLMPKQRGDGSWMSTKKCSEEHLPY